MSPRTTNLNLHPASTQVKKHPASLKLSCPECFYACYPNSGKCTNRECPQYVRAAGGALTGTQLLRECAPPPLYHGRKWGEWIFDAERLTLVFRGKPVTHGDGSNVTEGVERYTAYIGRYEIDVEAIRQSSQLLDWIFQVGGKTWATARVTKDLINAFDSIFHPQQNLCSGGGNKVIENPTAFLKHRIETVGRPDGPQQAAA